MTTLDAALKLLSEHVLDAAREVAREAARDELRRHQARPEADEWVMQTEAARRAGVTPQTIREWLDRGLLGARGRRGRVNVARLNRYLAGMDAGEHTDGDEVSPCVRGLAASVLRKVGGR